MNIEENTKAAFQLLTIHIRRSIFHILRPEKPLENIQFSINLENQKSDNNKSLTSFVTVNLKIENREKFLLSVTMVGKFEVIENPPFSIDEFLSINAPAIIYPYVRQHVRSLTLEAGISPIVLPVVNFVELHKSKNDK